MVLGKGVTILSAKAVQEAGTASTRSVHRQTNEWEDLRHAYAATFISVWRLFAAVDSTLVYLYSKRAAVGVRAQPH
jgi:hypothetical protein